jgi:hypothetical protein
METATLFLSFHPQPKCRKNRIGFKMKQARYLACHAKAALLANILRFALTFVQPSAIGKNKIGNPAIFLKSVVFHQF